MTYSVKTPVQEVLAAFERREFTNVEAFLLRQNEANSEVLIPVTESNKITKDNSFGLLLDRGNGPITEGMKSLEIISKSLRGINLNSLLLFDGKIIASSPAQMKSASDVLARQIVIDNIGMQKYIDLAINNATSEVDQLNSLCSTIAKRVKSGSFKYLEFRDVLLLRCKKVITAAIQFEARY